MGAKEQLEALRMMQSGYQGAPIRQPSEELNTLARLTEQTHKFDPTTMARQVGQMPLANIPYSAFNPTVGGAINLGANMMPFLGDAAALAEAKESYGKGNIGMAAFNAATAIPGIGDIAKLGLPAAAGIAGIIRQMAKRSGGVPVTPFGRQTGVVGAKSKADLLREEANRLRFGEGWDAPAQSIDDYGMQHRPSGREEGASLADLSNIYPDDIYSSKAAQYYGHYGQNNPMDVDTINIMQEFKGQPDKTVKIYRAVPEGAQSDIAKGDWTTINRDYAVEHGEAQLGGKYDIIEAEVKAGDIFTSGDSIHEWGYDPK